MKFPKHLIYEGIAGAVLLAAVAVIVLMPKPSTPEPALMPEEEIATTTESGKALSSTPTTSGVPSHTLPGTTVMAWIYPGNDVCSADEEFARYDIDVLKPEYFTVLSGGSLSLLTEGDRGCNGYSAKNAAAVKAHSKQQFVTVSSAIDGMQALTESPENRAAAIATLTTFVSDNGFTGVEIDFEDFSAWDASTYTNYQTFLRELGDALHARGKKLMVDVPPIGNATEAGYYPLTYADMAALPIDHIVIMAYDYQFDYGAGSPIAPNEWVAAVVARAKQSIPTSRLTIGIPSYGYTGTTGSHTVRRVHQNAISSLPGFKTAPLDPNSFERIWTSGRTSYVYVDAEGLTKKRAYLESLGVSSISVWALGGNPWFQ